MKSVLTFIAAVALSFSAFAQDTLTIQNFRRLTSTGTGSAVISFTSSSSTDSSLWMIYLATDSAFTTGPFISHVADSGIISGAMSDTLNGLPSLTSTWARIVSRLSPTGPYDTSASVQMIYRPTFSVAVTPGGEELYFHTVVNSGHQNASVQMIIWYDSLHTTMWDWYSYDVPNDGMTHVYNDTTMSYLAWGTEYYPEEILTTPQDTLTTDTALYTNAVPSAPDVNAGTATVTVNSVICPVTVNTHGLSGTVTGYKLDSSNAVIGTQVLTVTATAADQTLNFAWDTLQNTRQYGFEYKATNSIGSAWTGVTQYVTLATPGGLQLTISDSFSSYSNDILITTNFVVPMPFTSGFMTYNIFIAEGSRSAVPVSLVPHEVGDGTETAIGSNLDLYEVPTSSTPTVYYIWAAGNSDTSIIYSDTLVVNLAPTAVIDPSAVKEDVEVTVINMNGEKMCESYIVKPGEPIWRKENWIHGVYVACMRGMTTGTLKQEKMIY